MKCFYFLEYVIADCAKAIQTNKSLAKLQMAIDIIKIVFTRF